MVTLLVMIKKSIARNGILSSRPIRSLGCYYKYCDWKDYHTGTLEALANGPLSDAAVSWHRDEHFGVFIRRTLFFLNPPQLPDSASVLPGRLASTQQYTVVSRMVTFPDGFFPRKDVSRVVIFPDETFPRKDYSWMVGIMFNCSWRWSLTERPNCAYLNGFTVNSPH